MMVNGATGDCLSVKHLTFVQCPCYFHFAATVGGIIQRGTQHRQQIKDQLHKAESGFAKRVSTPGFENRLRWASATTRWVRRSKPGWPALTD